MWVAEPMGLEMEMNMTTQKQVPANIADCSKVRLGGASPSLPVRVAPATIADTGKVRMGGSSPSL
jgi:hypothetical protein